MVLLEALHDLAPQNDWQLSLAHLNHQLRGRSSDADERLVRSRAAKLGLPAFIDRADVRGLARAGKISIEMAAREARHDFLARIASKSGISAIALAHHADDQIELFFLRLLRGTGGEALAGMKWSNPSPSNPRIRLVRPLLDLPKSALRTFAKKRRIRFREDASNASRDIQRNRIRHELLPLLREKYQPALDSTVVRLMDIVGTEAQCVTDLARAWLEEKGNAPAEASQAGIQLSHDKDFASLAVAVQRRCLHLQLIRLGITPNFDLIETLRNHSGYPVAISPDHAECISTTSPKGSNPATLSLILAPSGMVSIQASEAVKFNCGFEKVDFGGRAGDVVFDGCRIWWQTENQRGTDNLPRAPGREWFDADKVGSSIVLRHWEAGDRFQPIGMTHAVKLQDFFTNQKVPRKSRHELILATSGAGKVFWVEGQRISEHFRVTKETIRRLQWRWQRV
jgi:tRNA(Ile)-lysidine synthase